MIFKFVIIFTLLLIFYINNVKSIGRQILSERKTFSIDSNGAPEYGENVRRGERANERLNLSYPGTKWCGPGNTASNYDDLGKLDDIDKCCRTHDHCDNIGAFQTKYNLTNNDFFTRLHCDCDAEFHDCLRAINTDNSNSIGDIYFTFRDKCYKEDYPIVECATYETILLFLRRCTNYLVDETQPKRYQWFDLPFYSNKNGKTNIKMFLFQQQQQQQHLNGNSIDYYDDVEGDDDQKYNDDNNQNNYKNKVLYNKL